MFAVGIHSLYPNAFPSRVCVPQALAKDEIEGADGDDSNKPLVIRADSKFGFIWNIVAVVSVWSNQFLIPYFLLRDADPRGNTETIADLLLPAWYTTLLYLGDAFSWVDMWLRFRYFAVRINGVEVAERARIQRLDSRPDCIRSGVSFFFYLKFCCLYVCTVFVCAPLLLTFPFSSAEPTFGAGFSGTLFPTCRSTSSRSPSPQWYAEDSDVAGNCRIPPALTSFVLFLSAAPPLPRPLRSCASTGSCA